MYILSFIPLALIAISGMLVSAGPIARDTSRDTTQLCGIPKPFTGERSCTPCKSSNNVCGTLSGKPTMLYCAGSPTRQWIPINSPSACANTGSSSTANSPTAKSPRAAQAASTPGCKSRKPFQQEAGCSKCVVEGKLVCGRDEGGIADLRCTRFGTSLSWVPVDAPGKCGV